MSGWPLLFVTDGAALVLHLARPSGASAPFAGLQRAVVYELLAFVATGIGLRYFGFGTGAVLAEN